MKSLTVQIFLSAILWVALSGTVLAETITHFHSDIHVTAEGDLYVTETIEYDFESIQRHGIYRTIGSTFGSDDGKWYLDRYADFEFISVSRNNDTEEYTVSDSNGLSVRIGHPDVLITGPQIYRIAYRVSGVMTPVNETQAELYWNVTGHDWEVPIETVSATIWSKEGIFDAASACYVGRSGASEPCTSIKQEGNSTTFVHEGLAPSEGLTVAQSITLPQQPKILERMSPYLLYGTLLALWLIGLVIHGLKWRFKYWKQQSIIAQYEPLPDVKPIYTGVLTDYRLDNRDVAAGIVYLAEQGFISITNTTDKVLLVFEMDDYEITLKRPLLEVSDTTHRTLLNFFFNDTSEIGTTIRLSEIRRSDEKKNKNAAAISALRVSIKKDLRTEGYFENYPTKFAAAATIIFFIILFAFDLFSNDQPIFEFLIFVEAALAMFVIRTLLIANRRTKKGYEAINHLKGFREFLSVTDKERFAFHNAPELSPQVFMTYLPYAIAFGVEEKWSEVFKDIEIADPAWYSGADGSSFNAALFASNLSAFSNSFGVPQSSARGGGFGSFGGGFSGGGFGGGGGGSW